MARVSADETRSNGMLHHHSASKKFLDYASELAVRRQKTTTSAAIPLPSHYLMVSNQPICRYVAQGNAISKTRTDPAKTTAQVCYLEAQSDPHETSISLQTNVLPQ